MVERRMRIAARASPTDGTPGRHARSPAEMPRAAWTQVLGRVWHEAISDRISLVAAGCAFWAMLALFPSLSVLITVYGMIFDPATVEPQLEVLEGLLPPAASQVIAERVRNLVSTPASDLGWGLAVSIVIAWWSASSGVKAMIAALNLAYEEKEERSILRFNLTALLITLGGVFAAVIGLAVLVALPAVLAVLGIPADQKWFVRVVSLVGLLVLVILALAVLYRVGPCRRAARWAWVTPGSIVAALLWFVASAAFSFYVAEYAADYASYGPLGAAVGLLMWFWVSAFAILLGAELNAELELQTARDSTHGGPRPMGQRGAFVADHVSGGPRDSNPAEAAGEPPNPEEAKLPDQAAQRT
jgi:membrane protein